MAITFQEVCEAIEKILNTQEKFTLQEVRQALGSRGSMSTISKFVQKWRSEHYMSQRPQASHMHPAPDSIMEAVTNVWQNMSDQNSAVVLEKEKLIADLKEDYDLQIEQLNQMLKSIEDQKEQQEQNLKQQRMRSEELEEKLNKMHQENQLLTQSQHQLKDQISQMQSLSQSFEKTLKTRFQDELDRLQAFHQQVNDQLLKHVSELKELNEQQRLEYLKKIDALQLSLKTLESQIATESYSEKVLTELQKFKDNQKASFENQNQFNIQAHNFFENYKKTESFLKAQIFCAKIHSQWATINTKAPYN